MIQKQLKILENSNGVLWFEKNFKWSEISFLFFSISIAIIGIGIFTRWLLTAYVFAFIFFLFSGLFFGQNLIQKKKRKEIDSQPYKLHRGKGMPQNPEDLYWLSLQSQWSKIIPVQWEEKKELNLETQGLKVNIEYKENKYTIVLCNQDANAVDSIPEMGSILSKWLQFLSSTYGTESFGMNQSSILKIGDIDLISMKNEKDKDYQLSFSFKNSNFSIGIDKEILFKLVEIDNTYNNGGKFYILQKKEQK